jgi:spermidine/putrescine-binding protein
MRSTSPAIRGLYYDPTHSYSLPYLWGTTGIGYDERYFESPPPQAGGAL